MLTYTRQHGTDTEGGNITLDKKEK